MYQHISKIYVPTDISYDIANNLSLKCHLADYIRSYIQFRWKIKWI